jgi:acyl-coenzyme A thioesterase PaaI-like protein
MAGPAPAGPAAPEEHTSDARLHAADALRRLGQALVAHQPSDEVLAEVARAAEALRPAVEAAPARVHAFAATGVDVFAAGAVDETRPAPGRVFPDCVVSGRANPMGLAARLWAEGDEAVLATTLGPAFEGAPGRAHGGVVAALIDETMGLVLSLTRTPAYTGRLCVTYRAPTPLDTALSVRARLAGREGRKLTITAELRDPERLLAEAEGLFIAVDPDRFLQGPAGG